MPRKTVPRKDNGVGRPPKYDDPITVTIYMDRKDLENLLHIKRARHLASENEAAIAAFALASGRPSSQAKKNPQMP